MRHAAILIGVPLALVLSLAPLTAARADKDAKDQEPQVIGDWTGSWGITGRPEAAQLRLDCKVVSMGSEKWEATFQGECGRPYKYTVKMEGRRAGNAVLFRGTADLGKQDGGVYDWIGRASEKEFLGYFTSEGHTGTFKLARP